MTGSSEPISGDKIIRPDALDDFKAKAESILDTIKQIREGNKDIGGSLKKTINQNPLKNSTDLKKQQTEVAALNIVTEKSIVLDEKANKLLLVYNSAIAKKDELRKKEQQNIINEAKLYKQREKAFDDYSKKEKKATDDAIKNKQKQQKATADLAKQEQASQRQREKDFEQQKKQNSVYQQSVARLADLKKELKELEIQEKTTGKLYKALGQEFVVLNGKVRDAEEGVGEFQRNVGNYTNLKQFQKALMELSEQGLGPGSKEFDELASKAGDFKDKINEAKEATKAFASGSKLQQAGNVLGDLKNDLIGLDFQGAAEKAKTFGLIMKSITFQEIVAGAKSLGTAFLELGKTLLANPIFLIGATIAAIAVGVYEYTQALKDNDEAIKTNNDFIKESNSKLTDLIDSIKEHRRQILLTQGVITQSQYDVQVAQSEARKKDEEETKRLAKVKSDISKQYGIDELSAIEQLGIATGLGTEILIEKFKNYSEKIKEEEKASLIIKIGIRQNLSEAEKEIREKDLSENRKLNDDKLKEEKKAAEERAKQKQKERDDEAKKREEEWNKILQENREFNEKIKRETNQDLQKKTEETSKNNDDRLKDEDDKIKKRTEANTAELEKSNEARKKKQEDDNAKAKEERIAFENQLFDIAENSMERRNNLKNKELDEEISQREKNIDRQFQLAANGQKNTLIFEQEQRDKALLAKKEQREKEVRQEQAIAFARLAAGYAEKDPSTAIPKALLALLEMKFIDGSFIEGTESVEKTLGKNKVHGGVDGYRIAVDGRERILNPEQNKMVGKISNDDLAMLAYKHNNGLLPGYIMNPYGQVNNTGENIYESLQYQKLIELNQGLKKVANEIRNIPQSQVNWDEQGNAMTTKVEQGMTEVIKYITSKPRL